LTLAAVALHQKRESAAKAKNTSRFSRSRGSAFLCARFARSRARTGETRASFFVYRPVLLGQALIYCCF
jgi:hypothetical protein